MKWTIPCFAVVLLCSIPSYFLWSYSTRPLLVGNFAQIAGLVFAFFSYLHLVAHYDKNHPLKSGWAHLALGVFIWLMAQCLEIYCELILNMIAYGTVSDGLWVVGYFPLIMGLQKLLRHRMSQEKSYGWKNFHIVLICSALIYSALFALLILPQLREENQPIAQTLLDFLYPTLDFILILHCLLLWKISSPHSEFFWFSILSAIAFSVTLVGDGILSVVKDFNSFVYMSVDIYYFISYFLMAIAADQEARRTLRQASPKVA
ncbi:hypothetical protein L0222_29085 [bacterium]|nr:hypothetical protein [bacterium]